MNEIMIFENKEFGKVRTVEINGEPWLVGKDVAISLGYQNPSKALTDHVDDEDKLNNESLSSLGQRGGWLINESGLYSLVLSSKLPVAKKFRRWVTTEVLPSIRKHGLYAVDQLLDNPELAIKAFTALKEERELRKALEAKVEADRPRVEFANAVNNSKGNLTVEKFAKVLYDEHGLKIGRNKMYRLLRVLGYLRENNVPYQKYLDAGYFTTCEVIRNGQPYIVTLVTGKGQLKLFERIMDSLSIAQEIA